MGLYYPVAARIISSNPPNNPRLSETNHSRGCHRLTHPIGVYCVQDGTVSLVLAFTPQQFLLPKLGMDNIPSPQPPGCRQDTATPPEDVAQRKGKRRRVAGDTPRKRAARA